MSRRFTLLAILLALMCGLLAAQQSEPFAHYNLPGQLDKFLKTTPNASLVTKTLGKLIGFQDGSMAPESHVTRRFDVTAAFTAVAASSSADPKLTAKGIEARFEYLDDHGDKKPLQVVYLDEEGLPGFQDRLRDLSQVQKFAPAHFHSDESTCHVVPAINRVTGAEEILHQKADKAFVLIAGWYWRADETGVGVAESGVCIDVVPGVASFFPNARLDQLIEMVVKGRAFLAAN